MKPRRNLRSEKSREFWAIVDKIALSRDTRKPIEIGDPWLDSYRDVSASLVTTPNKEKEQNV